MFASDQDKPSDRTRPARAAGPSASMVPALAGIPLTGPSPSPAAVAALQRSVGNAAVARMLEQSRHQHGADCGHRQDATAVQRSAVDEVLRSSGAPLEKPVRQEMETRLGADFSDVRLHTGSTAQRSAAEIGARAYTSGSHIVIGQGGADRHTLAHELTHVVQQRSGPVAGTDNGSGLRVSDPGDRFERAAEANATRVMQAPLPAQRAAADGPSAEAHGPAGGAQPVQRALDYHSAVPLPQDVGHRPTVAGGRVVASEMLSDGVNPVGWPPNQDPLGYDYIRSLGQTSNWIRFHLVNEKAGGPGTANNMVPAGKSDNSVYETSVEAALKTDVDRAARAAGDHVYFGVEVVYGQATAPNASAHQAATTQYFPSSLNVYHKYYSATTGWTWKKQGTLFTFNQPQPRDSRVPINLSAVTLDLLKQYTGLAPGNTIWNADDVAFLHSIAGPRQQEFATLLGGGRTAEDVYHAFELIPFRPARAAGRAAAAQGATKFGQRITEAAVGEAGALALQSLSFCISTGLLRL